MANNLIQIKRTSVSGRAANTTTLPNPGELAINITDGIMYSTNGSVVFEVGANNTNSQVSGTLTVNSVSANGSLGADGQVLTSNGTTVYWSAVSGGLVGGGTVSQVNTGVGLTGGPIDTTGTISVNPNTGIVANASGLFVNSAYIETLDANNASFLNGNTAADLRSYSDTVAGTAYSNAVSTAATDATNKAANAYSNAVSYAGSIAATAYSNAVATAASDATSKAATAYSNSVSYAGTIAGTAYSNAVSTAATDATNKAANAYSNAVSTAATDATNKAANAYSNSVTYFNANVNNAIDARVSGANVVTVSDTQTLTNKTLITPSISTPTFTGTPIEDVYAISGTSVSLEPDNGSVQTHTLSGATTYTDGFSSGQAMILMIDDGTDYTITWPTVTWVNNGGSAPTLAATGYTVVTLWKVSTTLYGALVGDGT